MNDCMRSCYCLGGHSYSPPLWFRTVLVPKYSTSLVTAVVFSIGFDTAGRYVQGNKVVMSLEATRRLS